MFQWNLPFKKSSLFLMVLFALQGAGCGFRHEKESENDSGVSARQLLDVNSIGYAEIKSAILTPKCLGCHSGNHDPSLTTYEEVKRALPGIEKSALRDLTMPKRGPLAANLRTALEAWIKKGAPEFAERPSTSPTPSDTPGSLRPVTFVQFKEKVLETHCLNCHAIGNRKGLTELETYKSVMSVNEWLKPMIFGVVNGEAVPKDQLMPPSRAPQLSDEQKAILLLWFQDGLKEK